MSPRVNATCQFQVGTTVRVAHTSCSVWSAVDLPLYHSMSPHCDAGHLEYVLWESRRMHRASAHNGVHTLYADRTVAFEMTRHGVLACLQVWPGWCVGVMGGVCNSDHHLHVCLPTCPHHAMLDCVPGSCGRRARPVVPGARRADELCSACDVEGWDVCDGCNVTPEEFHTRTQQ